MLEILLEVVLVVGMVAGAMLVMVGAGGLRAQGCPYCAKGYAVFKHGRDLVCWRCRRDSSRRIRSAIEDPPAGRRGKIRILK